MHTRGLGNWSLDEGSGQTAHDISGQANHGTLGSTPSADSADPSWVTAAGLGDRLTALRFGGDDHVVVEDSPSLEPGDVTVEAWVRAATSPGAFRYVVSKGAVRCERASYGLYTGQAGGLAFYVSNGTTATFSPDAGAAVWDGRWHHVAGTFGAWDGNRVRLYVDGKQVDKGTVSTVPLQYGLPQDDRFYIGNYLGDCPYTLGFVGDIDNLRLWNVAMTAGDVALLARG